jgi:drug/metabolite transporter (DMT)-like permease
LSSSNPCVCFLARAKRVPRDFRRKALTLAPAHPAASPPFARAQVVNAAIAAVALLLVPASMGGASGATDGRQPSGALSVLTADVPLHQWLVVALAYLGAHKFGIGALRHLPLFVQVVLKSSKSIFVMAGEKIFAGKVHALDKVVSVVLLSAGVGIFLLCKEKKAGAKAANPGDFNKGLLLVVGALICDAIYGPYQSRLVKQRKHDVDEAVRIGNAPGVQAGRSGTPSVPVPVDISCFHLMFNMNAWQGLFSLIIAYHGGDFPRFAAFVERQPDVVGECSLCTVTFYAILAHNLTRPPNIFDVVGMITTMCITMASGSFFIFAMLRYSDSLSVTITTTVRKLVTVLLSVFGPHGACSPPRPPPPRCRRAHLAPPPPPLPAAARRRDRPALRPRRRRGEPVPVGRHRARIFLQARLETSRTRPHCGRAMQSKGRVAEVQSKPPRASAPTVVKSLNVQ